MFAGKRVRAARVALAAAGMLTALAAAASDYRIGSAPAWVEPVPFDSAAHPQADAANVAYGARYDLVDDQVRLAAHSRARFHHVVSEAITDKGIDDLSHREIEVDPGWESLVISQLDVIRGGKRVSRLRDVQVKVLQRERDLESRIYDGRKMIALDLPDIRVGDIVEFAYTRSGMNPVFQGHHAGDFDMQWQVPVAHLHRRLSTAPGLNLRVAQLTGAVAPQIAQAGGFDERVWDVRDVPGLRIEASVPGTYNPYPWIEWSDFATWGEVARWAERLYQAPAHLSPALQAAVDDIAQRSHDGDARIVAVLRLVQQQVRYLGVEIGAGTHAPSAPDVVYARRWGDCKEKALLMVTMLRALGIDASPALVNTERRNDIAHDLPNAGSFDHAITRVRFNGLDYWLDPTRPPQQGTLASVSQPDYARALVLDGRSSALTTMRANTVAAHAREVRIDVDSRAGFDQPVRLDVRTTYLGFSADMMRDELGDGERADLQHRYLNFYAASYAGIQVAAPFDVDDDARANTVVVTEHYAVKDFWPADAKGARQASLHVPEIDNELRTPDEPIRTMPLALHGPQSVREEVRVQLPQAWPDRRFDRTVANDAFRLSKSLRVHDRTLTADYLLEISKDQVDAASVATLATDIGKARRLLGDSVSTAGAGSGGSRDWAAWLLPCLGVFGVLQAGVWARRLVHRLRARRAGPAAPVPPLAAGHAAAANDSEQPLAA
jgi:transglutaminase-like putative cysteine protease